MGLLQNRDERVNVRLSSKGRRNSIKIKNVRRIRRFYEYAEHFFDDAIQAQSMDMMTMMTAMMGAQAETTDFRHEKDAVYSSAVLYNMVNSIFSSGGD